MLIYVELNSPPHIGTRGQTLGVKQPDSEPGGLLIKRLLKTDILKNLWKLPTAQAWSWHNARMINRKWHCPALSSWSLDSNTKNFGKVLGGCENGGQKIALTRFDLGKASMVNLWNCCSSSSTTPFFSSASPFYRNLKIVLKSMFCLQFRHSSLGQCWRSELFARNVPMSISERPKPSLLDRLLFWWLPANLTSSFWGKIKCNHLTEKPQYDVKKQSSIVRISKMKNHFG